MEREGARSRLKLFCPGRRMKKALSERGSPGMEEEELSDHEEPVRKAGGSATAQ